MRAFPRHLAKVVLDRWDRMIGGEYRSPPCPAAKLLTQLLETAYLAANAPEEGRYPRFNVVATPSGTSQQRDQMGLSWLFTESRPLSVSELRRLAPAVDANKSAIWIEWDEMYWKIVALTDFGTSWHRARMGLGYDYQLPSCLFVQVIRPGRMRVYQGQFLVAALTDGGIERSNSLPHLGLHEPVNAGLVDLENELVRPQLEDVREWAEFEFIALWNTFAAVANAIASNGHGGAIIIVPDVEPLPQVHISIKYAQDSLVLRRMFVGYMNARHIIGDLIAKREENQPVDDGEPLKAELALRNSWAPPRTLLLGLLGGFERVG